MRRRWILVVGTLVMALVVSGVVATAATSLFGTRFRVGETIQFEVEDSTSSWWWGCCCCCPCEETTILSWRIEDLCGVSVYSVVHDAPVPASAWLGTWSQTEIDGSAVSGGQYILYVNTSAGTLSRCFTIYDPCSRCWSYSCSPCTTCACNQVTSITDCGCKTSLVFVDTCTTGCYPFFGLFGCCSSYSSCCP